MKIKSKSLSSVITLLALSALFAQAVTAQPDKAGSGGGDPGRGPGDKGGKDGGGKGDGKGSGGPKIHFLADGATVLVQ